MSKIQDLVFHSPYLAVVSAQKLLNENNIAEAAQILAELEQSMGRSEKGAVKNQLIRLMKHIIKWLSQPDKRSPSWMISIRSARSEIADSQEEVPSLNQDFILSIWEDCFTRAWQDARDEIADQPSISALTWDQVFHDVYELFKEEK